MKKILLVIIMLWISTGANAEIFDSMSYRVNRATNTLGQKILPKIYKTAKGIDTLLISDTDTSMVSIVCSLENGRLYDAPGKEGISNLYMNLLLNDRVEYKAKEIIKALENIGGGISINQDYYHMFIKIKFPVVYIKEFQDILKNIFFNTNFTRAAFEEERNYLSGQSGMLYRSPHSLGTNLLKTKLYPQHLFSSFNFNMSSISFKDVCHYADNYFSKENAHVTAIGNITAQQLENFVDNLIGNLPAQKVIKGPKISQPTVSPVPGIFHIEKDEKQSTIIFGIRCPAPNQPQWPAILLLNSLLSVGDSSRMYKILRNQLGLTYTPYSQLWKMNSETAFLQGSFTTNSENTQQGVDALFGILKDLHTIEIKAKELEKVKDSLIEELTVEMTSTLTTATILEEFHLRGQETGTMEEFKNSIKNVTLEDINAVAKEYFNPENFTVVCVGPVKPMDSVWNAQQSQPAINTEVA